MVRSFRYIGIITKTLGANGLKRNIKESYFGQTDMEYLCFWLIRTGVRPINKKVEAIVKITPPENQECVCSSIGLVKYYKGIWDKRSHFLKPLT